MDLPNHDENGVANTRTFSRSVWHGSLLLLTAGAVVAFLPLWPSLLLASWMAILARPLHSRLSTRVGGRHGAAGVLTVIFVLVGLAPLVLIGLSLFGATIDLLQQLQRSAGAREALDTLLSTEPTLSRGTLNVERVMDFARQHGGGALSAVGTIFGAATSGAIGLLVFVFAFYAYLVDGRRAYAWLMAHLPMPQKHLARLAGAFEETGRGLLLGVGLTALCQGLVATVGYLVIGIPQALVLGLLTIFAALIPTIGTGLVWIPVSAILFATGEVVSAVATLALGCVISVADNFIRPMLSRSAHLELPTFVLFAAMLGGIGIFGAWGLLAGPLFVRLAVEALRLWREQREPALAITEGADQRSGQVDAFAQLPDTASQPSVLERH